MARGSHKVQPVGFRLGVNKNWSSRWYADKKVYANFFLEDLKIKKIIGEKLKNAGVASILIKRAMSKIIVEIEVARPGVVIGKGGAAINQLKAELSRAVGHDVETKIYEVKNPEIVAKLVAESIALQCERRVAPKMAAAKAVEAAKESGLIKGIEIWVGGRIRGAEMARREKARWGVVPRHTLRADIDYAFATARVPSAGVHGIKVWINKGEKLTYSID